MGNEDNESLKSLRFVIPSTPSTSFVSFFAVERIFYIHGPSPGLSLTFDSLRNRINFLYHGAS